MKITVLTRWVGNGTQQSPFRPEVLEDYPGLPYADITQQPADNLTPSPNLFVCVVFGDESVVDTLLADPKYEVLNAEAE